jgi:hypothetical protein
MVAIVLCPAGGPDIFLDFPGMESGRGRELAGLLYNRRFRGDFER